MSITRLDNGFGNYTETRDEPATFTYADLPDPSPARSALWIMAQQGPRALINFPIENAHLMRELLGEGLVNALHRFDPADRRESIAYQLTQTGWEIAMAVVQADSEKVAAAFPEVTETA